MKPIARITPAIVLLFWAAVPVFAVEENVEYVENIGAWAVEVFSGAQNPGGLLQGPRLQAGHDRRGPIVFLPGGEAFTAGEGVVFVLTKPGVVRFLAGDPDLPGYRDGDAGQALLGRDLSLCHDGHGGLYIADRDNRCLRRARRVKDRWVIETVAGDPGNPADKSLLRVVRDESPMRSGDGGGRFASDGTGGKATFHYLHSNVIADAAGNAYLIDADFLRRITPEGKVETLNPAGGTGPPAEGKAEPLRSARFRLIMAGGICFGGDGCIYVADRWNHCVRRVDLNKQTVSVAIGPGRGYVDGPAGKAGFHDSPGHITYDPYRKRLYVTGVDDWGLRTFDGNAMKTIAGGNRRNSATGGPAREAGIHWGGVRGVDPAPPHDIYFWSGHRDWRGRTGRLFQPSTIKEPGK